MIKISNCLLTLLIALFLVDCRGGQGEEKKGEEKKDEIEKKDETPKGLTPQQAAKVVAKVGDRTITVGEVTEQINRLSPYIRRRWAAPEKRREFLQKLIRVELLSQEAERLGLDDSPEVQRTVKQVMIRLLIKNDLEKEILPSSIEEKALREEYEKDHDKYHRPAQIRASQIVVAEEKKALEIIADLKANKEDRKYFRAKAASLSIDEDSKARGGDMGYFSKPEESRDDEPKIPKEVAEAAWKIKKIGDLAPKPIKTQAGYHVVKLVNRKPEMSRSFESVKRLLENRVLREIRREGMQKFVDKLKSEAKIEIFENNLAKIEIDTQAPQKEEPKSDDSKEGASERPSPTEKQDQSSLQDEVM